MGKVIAISDGTQHLSNQPSYRDHPADVVKDILPSDLAGAKVVFINMPLRETAVPNATPEGPLLLATNLRQAYGVQASVIDLNAYRIKDEHVDARALPNGRHLTESETRALLEKHFHVHGEPDVVALSGMITTLRWQTRVAELVRKIVPSTFLVSGGGLATELKTGLFNYIPDLDAIAHSEGDDVVVKIVYDGLQIKRAGFESAIASGKLAPYFLGELHGRPRLMYAGDRPRDLDCLPPADLELLREDVNGFPILDYYLGNAVWGVGANNSSATPFSMTRSTTSVSSRGCPYGCKYCYRGAQGERRWGIRSAEHMAAELAHHKEMYGIDFKGFPDDNFAVTTDRIARLVPLIGPLGVPWGTHTRLDEAAGLKPKGTSPGEFIFEDPLRIKLMAEAGCVYIGFGPESASRKILDALGKGGHTLQNGFVKVAVDGGRHEFPRSMIDGIRNCQDAGIHANCTWIMGSPTETLDDLKETANFIRWQEEFYAKNGISSDAVNKRMFTLTWYPGTEIIRYPGVRDPLARVFGITFDHETHEPICDEKFRQYCLELDDATKILCDPGTGDPLNFSEIPTDQFLEAREYIDRDETFRILDM